MHATLTDTDTSERLLRAAAEVFAQKGYEAATVREICQAAGANVAAVNYHFGGKERLYAAVLAHFERRAQELFPLDIGLPPDPTPEDRLRACIRALLLRVTGDGDPMHAAQGKLLTLEIMNPTPALDPLVDTYMRPCVTHLASIMLDLLGQDAAPDLIRDCIGGVVGQCIFYGQHRAIIPRFHPEVTYDAQGLVRIVEAILRFSLHGIRGIQRAAGRE